MTHATEVELEMIASGLSPLPGAARHVEACDACARRLATLRREVAGARDMPAFAIGARRLEAMPRGAPSRASAGARWRRWWPAVAIPAVAAALVLALPRAPPPGPPDAVRTKGAARLLLVRAADGEPVAGPDLAAPVELRVLGGGNRYLLVLGVDAAGEVRTVWPESARESGPVPRDARLAAPAVADLPLLHAVFSDEPLPAGPVRDALAAAARRCHPPLSATCLDGATVAGAAARFTLSRPGDGR